MPGLTRTGMILALTALVVAYFAATAAGNAFEGRSLARERLALEREIASYQSEYRQLDGLRRYLQSNEYIETIARRELGLVMPGEPAIVIVSPQPVESAGRNGELKHWWQVLLNE